MNPVPSINIHAAQDQACKALQKAHARVLAEHQRLCPDQAPPTLAETAACEARRAKVLRDLDLAAQG